MRSLFLRVFLAFWFTVAVVLIIGGHIFHMIYRSETGVPELMFAIAISGLPCFFLARYLARPIVSLRTATHEIAEGNLAARAGQTLRRRKDEIGLLVADFDHMAERLEALVGAQKRLIADISHELRSPLTRLGLALELARRRPADGTSALDRAERETRRLNELIGKLLVLSLMEGGNEMIERSVVQLGDLVADVVADADFEACTQHRTVKSAIIEQCTTIGNPDLLRSAVENVVRNAVRYTPEETEVQVSVHLEGSDNDSVAVIEVSDHGPGVPEAELSQLFRPFYRVDPARGQDAGGTGLGLAITQRAVELHKGSVSARNSPGNGLLVKISVPAVPRMADAR
jgi:two-component system sensor histidine kinase CpxA